MKNKIVRMIYLVIIIIILLTFHSCVFAVTITTIMSEGEFAKYVQENEKWFWSSMGNGILANKKQAKKGEPYFGANLLPKDGAAKQTNGACLYHLQKNIGDGDNHSCITNLIEFDGSKKKMIIYGGTDIDNGSKEEVKYSNTNAVAKILRDAYKEKGESEGAASDWGATVWHSINEAKKELNGKVHANFFTNTTSTYTPQQKAFAKKKYNKATKLKAIQDSDIKFKASTPTVTTAVIDKVTYTYIGPFKISGSGTIKDIVVNNHTYSKGEVKWSTKADSTGLKTGCDITKNINFYIRVKADLSTVSNITTKITTQGGKYYKARMALITYIIGEHGPKGSSQNLGIFRGKEIEVKSQTITKKIGNTGDLEIIKQDTDSKTKLSGVRIKITGPNKYDKTFVTNNQGKVSISDLPTGTYKIQEVSNPSYGYTKMVNKTVVIPTTSTVTLNNTRQTGNLEIIKIDADSKIEQAGVKFKVKKVTNNTTKQYIKAIDSEGEKNESEGRIDLVNLKLSNKKDDGTTFITDDNGSIRINNLLIGTYEIEEIENPNDYGYTKRETKKVEVVIRKSTEPTATVISVPNQKQTGNLQIIKEDSDKKENKLKDVKFKIKVKNTNQYIKAIDSTGEKAIVTEPINLTNLGFKNNKEDGTTFITDDKGSIRINNLLIGTYIIEEIDNPNYGYTQKATEEVTVTRKKTTETTVQVKTISNEEQTGNLRISKIDTDSGTKLKGVVFKIKNSQGKYIQAVTEDGIQTKVDKSILLKDLKDTDKENEATEFITNEEGIIEIHKLLIDTYEVIELSLGEENSNYEIDDNYISWESNVNKNGKGRFAQVKVERQSSENTQDTINNYVTLLTIKNKKKYVDIKGYVWLDIEGYSKSEYQTNGHYRADHNDSNDRLLEGIMVQLKDEKGQIVQLKNENGEFEDAKVSTDKNGEYSFKKVEIKEIDNYQVEFVYNGMGYQAVEKDLQKDIEMEKRNGSTADEVERDRFNEGYETITYGQSNQHDLEYEYNKEKYESKLLYGDKENYNFGHEKNKEEGRAPVSGVEEQYRMQAITKLAEIISSEEINKNDITEVANLNLGIERRVQPDLSLGKEINSVKVSINTENHVYQYVDRYQANKEEDKDRMDPKVKFETMNGTYTRPVYASDVYYEGDNPLQVKVTYKIRVSLDAFRLTSKVNEITDYYDKKYIRENDKVKVGKEIDKNGDIKEENRLEFEFDEQYSNEDYYRMKIKNPCTLSCNSEEKDRNEALIYVQLEVKPENIKELLEEQNKLYNQVEITSYSTYQNDKPYAGIDPDSQPGNLEIGNTSTYEDDNDMAPGLQIILQDERKTDGNVFMDEIEKTDEFNPDGLNTAKIRQGSGIYEAKEKGVSGVTVQLVEVDANTGEMKRVAQVYNQTTKQWVKAEDITDENGEYTIAGFIPGYYKIVYIWGGQTYIKQTGEEQKIRVQDYKGTVYLKQERQEHEEWYKTKEPRYSDAMDHYETRQMIDKQMTKITNANKHTIENYSGTLQLSYGKDEEDIITKMDSGTPKFKVNIEYESKTEDDNGITKEYELNDDGSIRMDGIYAIKKDEYKNYLQHIDFGIVERAKQALSLSKKIQRLKITVTDGTILVNAKVKEDGTLENEVKHTVYIPKSEGANGQFKVEIDNEVIQGAQLEITYQFQVVNKSELDYVNRDYYWYGKGYGQNSADLVKLRASGLIDYLDNGLTAGQKQESEGNRIVQGNDKKGTLISDGLLEDGQESKSILNQTEKILIKEFNEELTPIENYNMEGKTFVTNKLLANISTDDEMIFDNDAEIVEIMKTGGSSLVTIPGNYTRSESSKEMDNDTAESVIIIPPTGLTVNSIGYVILAIISFGILIVGVILIKKFVLK